MARQPRKYRRRLFLEPLEDRLLLAADPLGGGGEGEDPALVNIILETTDLSGNVITSIDPGEDFLLNTSVQDQRSPSLG
ncbi:MAG: LEPR-XLL domain-containing protein, partial [Pirellulaceae bacterium]